MRASDLNYQHLRYFHAVAREGSVLRAARTLHLAPSTVSGQIKTLEQELGRPLFERVGRGLVLTEFGQRVLTYADAIFELGEDLVRTAIDGPRRERVRIGVSSVLPKLLARAVLQPALKPTVELDIEHGNTEDLLGALASRRLDVVLSDIPPPTWLGPRAVQHKVVSTGIAVFGTQELADRVGTELPGALARVPWLVPPTGTSLRRGLDAWWDEIGLAPEIAAVVDDSALLKALGDAGAGIFAAPASMEAAILDAYDLVCLGTTDRVTEEVWAITREAIPASVHVRAICGLVETAQPIGSSDA